FNVSHEATNNYFNILKTLHTHLPKTTNNQSIITKINNAIYITYDIKNANNTLLNNDTLEVFIYIISALKKHNLHYLVIRLVSHIVKSALLNKSNFQETGGSERYSRFSIGSSWQSKSLKSSTGQPTTKRSGSAVL
ncbi:hypothetical protein P9423_22710, partial [Enterobacter mori]|uniref:hypothetical protein n=1 Tax=Enterobacter mori TaxID=539813 RepID=UPI003891ADFE